jgi:hypothetical protein
MNITPVFNQVLASHNAPPVGPYVFRLENLDEFLKEAYRIVGHVTRLELEGSANHNYHSVHTSRSSTRTSSRYGSATFLPYHRHGESRMRLQTKTRSTSPMRNVTKLTPKRDSRCES